MPHSATTHTKGPDPRSPLVFDTRDLGPGSARTLTRTVAAPDHMGVELVRVPVGAELELEVRLEGVTEGVLVTVLVTAPLAGECARCLEPFTSAAQVRFQELFAPVQDAGDADDTDSYPLDGSGLLNLEPALRDAMVLELPLSPLCEAGCRGLCAECGARLADAGPAHSHEVRGIMWSALRDFRATATDAGSRGEAGPDGSAGREFTTDRTDTAPEHAKER